MFQKKLMVMGMLSEADLGLLQHLTRKLYVRRNNNKVSSIETRRIVIAHLLP